MYLIKEKMEIKDVIHTVISSNSKGDKLPTAVKRNIVISVIDSSGSTSFEFHNKKSILTKELELYENDILSNETDVHYMYSFASDFIFHNKINVLHDEGFVDLPKIKATSATNTSKPLLDILTKINTLRPDIIRIYTDGNTTSSQFDIKRVMDKFAEYKIKVEIIAVTDSITNFEQMAKNEESSIPGMDLINWGGSSISSLKIYNKEYINVPYVGALNSKVDKNCIKFMDIEIGMPVIQFILQFVDEIIKSDIDWGNNYIDLKKTLTEIGKLWSLLMIEFSGDHPFIFNIITKLQLGIKDDSFTKERIITFIKYGFNCVKQNKPIIMTNFEERAKESVVKKTEFKDAVNELSIYGTALGSNKLISIPDKNGMCIIGRSTMIPTKKTNRDNLTIDKHNNLYLGIDASDQAIRIGLRNYAGTLGWNNARGSPSVIFMVLNQMSLLCIKGMEINCDYMNELRKIAIAQTSMEGMIAKQKYDGVGFYTKWKSGIIPPIHYSDQNKTHTSLANDTMINPLELPETIWWALMMSMLDIFDKQKSNYEGAIQTLGIEVTRDKFLEYIKNTYKDQLKGNATFKLIGDIQKSLYTLDDFEEGETIFSLKNHTSPTGFSCHANTWYSQEEIDLFIKKQGCAWCQYRVTDDDFERVIIENATTTLKNLSETCSQIKLIKEVVNNTTPIASVTNSMQNLNMDNLAANSKKIRINLVGVTGSGKTTCTEKMNQIITANGGFVCIISADKWSKQGFKGKDIANKVKNEIMTFDRLRHNGLKVVIMDLCNESGVAKKSFNFNFSEYKDLVYYPNMNKDMFKDYEAWCLNNVISRPIHDRNSNYLLNPVSAGLNICIKVHNGKAGKIKQMIGGKSNNNFNENDTLDTLHKKIDESVDRYKQYLATQNFEENINKFLTDNSII